MPEGPVVPWRGPGAPVAHLRWCCRPGPITSANPGPSVTDLDDLQLEPYDRELRPDGPLTGEVLLNDPLLVERSRRPGPVQRVRNIWHYRELLANLTRLELKVKYKNSVLGFVWSLLNPAMYLAVFGVVFGVFLPNNIPQFAIFLLAGLLVWNFFSAALTAGAGSIVGNASLVTKVWFPREILPLASIGAAGVHLMLQSVVLLGALAVFQRVPSAEFAPLLAPALIDLLLLTAAFSILLAAVNVYLRDTQHLLELGLVAWFWASAIVYGFEPVTEKLAAHGIPDWVFLMNPIVPIVLVFQRVFYNPTSFVGDGRTLPDHPVNWYLGVLGLLGLASLLLLLGALWVFGRLEDNFAEEI